MLSTLSPFYFHAQVKQWQESANLPTKTKEICLLDHVCNLKGRLKTNANVTVVTHAKTENTNTENIKVNSTVGGDLRRTAMLCYSILRIKLLLHQRIQDSRISTSAPKSRPEGVDVNKFWLLPVWGLGQYYRGLLLTFIFYVQACIACIHLRALPEMPKGALHPLILELQDMIHFQLVSGNEACLLSKKPQCSWLECCLSVFLLKIVWPLD